MTEQALQNYRTIEQEAGRLRQEVSRWERQAAELRGLYAFLDRRQEPLAARQMEDLARDLSRQADALERRRDAIAAAVDAVPEERLRELLILRYGCGLTFAAIADQMGYSQQYILRLHRKALDALQESPEA